MISYDDIKFILPRARTPLSDYKIFQTMMPVAPME